MFAAETELDLFAERGSQAHERWNPEVMDLALEQLPLAKVVRQRQGAVAQEIENVPEENAVSIEDDAALRVDVFGHDGRPGSEHFREQRLAMIAD